MSDVRESGQGQDRVLVQDVVADEIRETGKWKCHVLVEDYAGDVTEGAEPIRTVEGSNLLMHGGVSLLWQHALGNGTTTAGQALTYLNNANAAIGAGNGTTAAAATQTNLQGASKLRKGMDATYPQHTDGTTVAAKTITFRSTFSTGEANFDWQEVAIFNTATADAGRMLNRLVQAIGTKTSAVSRVVTVTVDIA